MSETLFNVRDKIIVITGGLGLLGSEFAKSLLDQGAKVAIFDSGKPKKTSDNKHLLTLEVDVTSRDSLTAALNEVKKRWGVPHGLVLCAALDSKPDASLSENGPFEKYPEEVWDKTMDVNVKGAFLCCQVIGGEMAKAKRGSIVHINSIYGLVSPDQRVYKHRQTADGGFYKPVAYSVSKSALLNLTRYLATYWAPVVRVNTLTLGGVFQNQDEKFLEAYKSRVPLARMARSDEYNGAVLFLLSDASSYMTGSNLVIDGGWTAW
jgi:NAD(P)-dependent dehydrogenase (short-subunit alcohol dehydrogenase family)